MTVETALRSFVQVGGRQVHYVRWGAGPPLVMLHAAPCSSKVMAPIQRVFANGMTTFAIDLPGCGLSGALPLGALTLANLADGVLAAMDAIGLRRVLAYGRHTGAGVAVELANRHPDRVALVLADGFPVFAEPMSEARIDETLVPLSPRWDGSHLTWCWYRYREQHVFAPWDRPSQAFRADTDVPGPDELHRGTVEMLEAGDEYRRIFAAAFRHPGLSMIGDVTVPVCYGARPGDSLYASRTLYPAGAWQEVFPRDAADAAVLERALLLEHAAPLPSPPPHVRRLRPGQPGALMDYLPTPAGETLVRCRGLDGPGTPVLLLHDIPGASALETDLLEAIGAVRPAVGFDLCGLGESLPPSGDPAEIACSVERWVAQARSVCDQLGIGRVHLLASGAAAAVAVELALAEPGRVAGLTLRSPALLHGPGPQDLAERPIPTIRPADDGAHLLRLWHYLRDRQLWFPWFRRTREHARDHEPQLDPAVLTATARALLKQPHTLEIAARAALGHPWASRLRSIRGAVTVVSHLADLFAPCGAGAGLGLPTVALPDGAAAMAAVLDGLVQAGSPQPGPSAKPCAEGNAT